MVGNWSDRPPADARPGDWVAVRVRLRKWQILSFPARLVSQAQNREWAYVIAHGRTFLTEEKVHQFWYEVYRKPEGI